MSKSKANKSFEDAAAAPRWSKPLMSIILLAAVVGAAGYGLTQLENRVLTGQAGAAPQTVRVQLAEWPAWMPRALAGQIADSLLPRGAEYYDEALVEQVRAAAEANPWVRRVAHVEKRRGQRPGEAVVQVQAEFRMAVARLHTPTGFAYVDAEGFRLPAEQVPQWAALAEDGTATYFLGRGDVPHGGRYSQIHYIIIDGVDAVAPAVGRQWPGEDLAAGLRLTALLAPRPYAYQITAVDVRNYDGRVSPNEPHLRMYAQFGDSPATDIRFGRFPMAGGDYVVSPARKLSYLDEYVQDHDGRLAGLNRYIDLRYDELHVSYN